MSPLENICTEILLDIADYLDRPSLKALSQCSKQLYSRLRPTLFKIVVLHGLNTSLFIKVAQENPAFASLVQHLTLACYCRDGHAASPNPIPLLPSIRGLTLVGNADCVFYPDGNGFGLSWPALNGNTGSKLEVLAQIPNWLPHLERCSLVPHFKRIWASDWVRPPLEQQAIMFLHPTLQRLDVDYADHLDPDDGNMDHSDQIINDRSSIRAVPFRSPIFEVDPSHYKTNLKTLTLTCCELHSTALDRILAFPRNLTTFSLTFKSPGEVRRLGGLTPRDLKAFRHNLAVVKALTQQSHSLSTLELQGLYGNFPIDLRSFGNLQTLCIDTESLLGWGPWTIPHSFPFGLGSNLWPSRNLGTERSLSEILPPSLRYLSLTHTPHKEQTIAHFTYLHSAITGECKLPAGLRHVSIVFDHTFMSIRSSEEMKEVFGFFREEPGESRTAILRFGDQLTELGVEVQYHLVPTNKPLQFSETGRTLSRIYSDPVEWPAVNPPQMPRWWIEP